MDQASIWNRNTRVAAVRALGGPQSSLWQNGIKGSCNSQRLFEFMDPEHN